MPSRRLVKLVCDLMAENSELRQRFNQDPAGVIAEYQLDANEKIAFYKMKKEDVADAVKQQIIAFGFPFAGDFPACNEEYKPDLGGTETEYPSPVPGLYRVRPRKATRAEIAAAGEQLELIVTAKSIARLDNTSVKILRLSDQANWVVPHDLFGTFRCSRLRVVAIPNPADATPRTIKAGEYKVLVVNNGDTLKRAPINEKDFEVLP